ncbi:MAG: DUF371 domain-containing protein [Candidatus Lokiarchaeota archaeon]|nr:DUF371 domain-containing protein [Candidatus Lokiarchaeota archaeon]
MYMLRVSFVAHGHKNIVGKHNSTLELTTENQLTRRGTCIVGVDAELALSDLSSDIKSAVKSSETVIELRMTVEGHTETVIGHGAQGLTYDDSTSMVARTSNYQCDRTLMVSANKAASNLNRAFITKLQNPNSLLRCVLTFK